jgi:hypothetical protein
VPFNGAGRFSNLPLLSDSVGWDPSCGRQLICSEGWNQTHYILALLADGHVILEKSFNQLGCQLEEILGHSSTHRGLSVYLQEQGSPTLRVTAFLGPGHFCRNF